MDHTPRYLEALLVCAATLAVAVTVLLVLIPLLVTLVGRLRVIG